MEALSRSRRGFDTLIHKMEGSRKHLSPPGIEAESPARSEAEGPPEIKSGFSNPEGVNEIYFTNI